jgi:hypothetical protein
LAIGAKKFKARELVDGSLYHRLAEQFISGAASLGDFYSAGVDLNWVTSFVAPRWFHRPVE